MMVRYFLTNVLFTAPAAVKSQRISPRHEAAATNTSQNHRVANTYNTAEVRIERTIMRCTQFTFTMKSASCSFFPSRLMIEMVVLASHQKNLTLWWQGEMSFTTRWLSIFDDSNMKSFLIKIFTAQFGSTILHVQWSGPSFL